jgi:hypothetical protein
MGEMETTPLLESTSQYTSNVNTSTLRRSTARHQPETNHRAKYIQNLVEKKPLIIKSSTPNSTIQDEKINDVKKR